MKDQELLEQVQQFTQGMGTKWCNHSDGCEGSGFVEDSVFSVRPDFILWIVRLCDGKVAYTKFAPDTTLNLILESPRIFVKYNKCHRIEDFCAFQKKCHEEKCHICHKEKCHDDKCRG